MAFLALGTVYVQTFANGDKVYFKPLETCKNGSFKGLACDVYVGARKPKAKTKFLFPKGLNLLATPDFPDCLK